MFLLIQPFVCLYWIGSDGINGQDPPIPDNSTVAQATWELPYFYCNNTLNNTEIDDEEGIVHSDIGFRVFGGNGTAPGDGGNGGVGGFGGNAGKVFVADLQNNANFSIFAQNGKHFLFDGG